jgi:hypothetical protein
MISDSDIEELGETKLEKTGLLLKTITSMNWIIEDGVFGRAIAPLIDEIQSQGHQAKAIDYIRGITDYRSFFPEDECVLFYGSLHIAEQILTQHTQVEESWVPGVIGTIQNYFCSHYYPYLNKWLFNSQHYILPLREASQQIALDPDSLFSDQPTRRLFIRPDSPLKPFPGGAYSYAELADLQSFCNRHYLDDLELLVVLAPERQVEAEWRVFIAEGQILSASQYRQFGKPYYQLGMPEPVHDLAVAIAQQEWQPDPIWVLDLCWSQGTAYLLEINFFSCSAFYYCDFSPIVKAASRIALEQWRSSKR